MKLHTLLYFLSLYKLATSLTNLNVLVLGGNGFLGSGLMKELFKHPVYKTTLVSRLNNYYNSDNEILAYANTVIRCDRDQLLRKACTELVNDIVYDYVVDFSSFKTVEMHQLLDILQNRIGTYIYLSTDSVYDVLAPKYGRHTLEDHVEEIVLNATAIKDSADYPYGVDKLTCEQYLKQQQKKFGFRYSILRLPDAFGEKDTSMRWWLYQLLLKTHKPLKVQLPLPHIIKNQTFSMVYRKDVAFAILQILEDPKHFSEQTINLAIDEPITLKKLLETMAMCLNITDPIDYDHEENTAWFKYPTGAQGPLNIDKYLRLFKTGSISSFHEATCDTVRFYENAMVDLRYAKDRELMMAEFIEDVLPENFADEELFTKVFIQTYGNRVFEGIDIGLFPDDEVKQIDSTHGEL